MRRPPPGPGRACRVAVPSASGRGVFWDVRSAGAAGGALSLEQTLVPHARQVLLGRSCLFRGGRRRWYARCRWRAVGRRHEGPAPVRPSTAEPPPRRPRCPRRAASDFMQCPLLYRLRVIDRLPEKPSAAATRGTLVHAVLERLFDSSGGGADGGPRARHGAGQMGAVAGRPSRSWWSCSPGGPRGRRTGALGPDGRAPRGWWTAGSRWRTRPG